MSESKHLALRFFDGEDAEINGYNLKRFVMQSIIGDSAVFRVHCPSTRPLLLDVFANTVSPGHYLTGQPIKFKSICKFKVNLLSYIILIYNKNFFYYNGSFST